MKRQDGFTLIEMVGAISVVAVLVLVGVSL